MARIALVVLGLVAGLLVAEGTLQVASVAYRLWTGGRSLVPTQRLVGATRILCVGDSNTFGIWVEPDQSYPAQLAALLDREAGPGRFEVINLGVPGAPSGTFRQQIDEILASYEPDVVIAMIGVNNVLRDPVAEPTAHGSEVSPFVRLLQQHSRLYALYRLVARSRLVESERVDLAVTGDEANATMQRADGAPLAFGMVARKKNLTERRRARAQIAEDLQVIDDSARRHGSHLVLMTYLFDDRLYGETNPVLRQAAADRDLPLIDNAAAPRPSGTEIFFSDGHPNAAGYALVARDVADFLLQRPAPKPSPPS